ncbi:prenyltransferase/squalene oxidase repeat-containing protein [Aquisphaera insulae]|uniref:prenyltransferase/squalene oxidase repeat-containing protein n=1 Tax=Aquisphaera insulae TaxID=2712864 RepID=UPI00196A68C9|nr:prenyltransferase/squalene oxidase repeat-containing protein [Aquisphaera insulae]
MLSERSRRSFLRGTAGVAGTLGFSGGWAWPLVARGDGQRADATPLITRAVAYLRGRQAADGSWSVDRGEPGITALVVAALLRSGQVTPAEPSVAKGLAYLESFLGPDGGLSKGAHSSYSTSVALLAFRDANRAGRYDAAIKAAQQFLRATQFDESNGTRPDNPYYGGAGYGPGGGPRPPQPAAKSDAATKKAATPRAPRPDLSNTSFMIEALRSTGVPADDPALRRAVLFISRCQNLKSEFNDQPWADKINDGGFIYTVANGGTSIAGKTPEGHPLSYGSMTYAGLKSMIYAGLTKDDPRVAAALGFIRKTYTVEANPGAGDRALYYYYVMFAKALAVLGEPTIVDGNGVAHDWRADLISALGKRQSKEGSWVNATDRFMEGDANLVTAYALLALGHAAGSGKS